MKGLPCSPPPWMSCVPTRASSDNMDERHPRREQHKTAPFNALQPSQHRCSQERPHHRRTTRWPTGPCLSLPATSGTHIRWGLARLKNQFINLWCEPAPHQHATRFGLKMLTHPHSHLPSFRNRFSQLGFLHPPEPLFMVDENPCSAPSSTLPTSHDPKVRGRGLTAMMFQTLSSTESLKSLNPK